MSTAFAFLFWFSVVLLIYHLLGYPALLALLVRLSRNPPIQRQGFFPFISIIIPAYNEGGVIKTKLRSILDSQYPPEKMEVICANDGSTDNTKEQILSIKDARLILDHSPERQGKMATLNRAVKKARGEYLVLTDANAILKPESLANLMSNFADPSVGCVSGRTILTSSKTELESSENLYWRYETWIKKQESHLGSTPAATGSLLALRRQLYTFPDKHIINDDFQIALQTVSQGYRNLYDATAVVYEAGVASIAEDYQRKNRISAGRWQLIRAVLDLAPRHPGFVFMFFSHKLLRLLIMPLMILALLSNLAAVIANPPNRVELASFFSLSTFWGQLILAGQLLFYLLAGLGALLNRFGIRVKPLYFLYYFISSQYASMVGLVRFVLGRQTVLWHKAAR